jgi:hypothetical protein
MFFLDSGRYQTIGSLSRFLPFVKGVIFIPQAGWDLILPLLFKAVIQYARAVILKCAYDARLRIYNR